MKTEIINGYENHISILQNETIDKLFKIFIINQIKNLVVKNYWYEGLRGHYTNKPNLCINFCFNYYEYIFEFFLSYDQIEYYISLNSKDIHNVIVEDFWTYEKMINLFFKRVITDMNKYNIPHN